MLDVSLGLLCHSCPLLSDLGGENRYQPSRWLTSGYAPKGFEDGSTGWQKLAFHEVAEVYGHWASAEEIATFYRLPSARGLLQRLSVTFAPFFPLSAGEWEADLRSGPNPITHLYLWQTAADVFDYYTRGKQFSLQARQEYLDTLWLFFNHGPDAAGYDDRLLRSLTLGRVRRVVSELERYFQRRRRCGSGQSSSTPAARD